MTDFEIDDFDVQLRVGEVLSSVEDDLVTYKSTITGYHAKAIYEGIEKLCKDGMAKIEKIAQKNPDKADKIRAYGKSEIDSYLDKYSKMYGGKKDEPKLPEPPPGPAPKPAPASEKSLNDAKKEIDKVLYDIRNAFVAAGTDADPSMVKGIIKAQGQKAFDVSKRYGDHGVEAWEYYKEKLVMEVKRSYFENADEILGEDDTHPAPADKAPPSALDDDVVLPGEEAVEMPKLSRAQLAKILKQDLDEQLKATAERIESYVSGTDPSTAPMDPKNYKKRILEINESYFESIRDGYEDLGKDALKKAEKYLFENTADILDSRLKAVETAQEEVDIDELFKTEGSQKEETKEKAKGKKTFWQWFKENW